MVGWWGSTVFMAKSFSLFFDARLFCPLTIDSLKNLVSRVNVVEKKGVLCSTKGPLDWSDSTKLGGVV